jgi:hypothetical protein
VLRRLRRVGHSGHESNTGRKRIELKSFGEHVALPPPPRK